MALSKKIIIKMNSIFFISLVIIACSLSILKTILTILDYKKQTINNIKIQEKAETIFNDQINTNKPSTQFNLDRPRLNPGIELTPYEALCFPGRPQRTFFRVEAGLHDVYGWNISDDEDFFSVHLTGHPQNICPIIGIIDPLDTRILHKDPLLAPGRHRYYSLFNELSSYAFRERLENLDKEIFMYGVGKNFLDSLDDEQSKQLNELINEAENLRKEKNRQ